MRNLFRRRIDVGRVDTENGRSCGLKFLAEHDGIGTARFHEFYFLRRQRIRDVDQLFRTIFIIQLLGLGIDGQNRAGIHRIELFQNRVAIFVNDGRAIVVELASPVLQIDADTAGYADRRVENWRDAIGAANDGRDIDERHIWACLDAGPKSDIVDA